MKNRKDLEKLNKLASLNDQIKAVRLQDKLGKHNFHEDMKNLSEPFADTIKNTSEKKNKN